MGRPVVAKGYFTTIIALTAVIVTTMAPMAAAHYTGSDSVDGGEIRYNDQTQWDGAREWAIDRWNALSGGVSVLPDNIWNLADLEFKDYSADDGLCGKYRANSGADDLWANIIAATTITASISARRARFMSWAMRIDSATPTTIR